MRLSALAALILVFSFHLTGGLMDAPPKKSLIYISTVDILTLNPGKVTDAYSSQAIAAIFEGLTRYKHNSPEVEPCLAVSWKSSVNGKRWVFRLRSGVRFHNGELLTAASVVRTFKKKLNDREEYREWNTFYTYLKDVKDLGGNRVEFLLSEPYAPFLFQLASPKSSIVALSSKQDGVFRPIGTGPFLFKEKKEGKFTRIHKFGDYWGEKARLSYIIFKVVNDVEWSFLQLKNGAADVMSLEAGTALNILPETSQLRITSLPSAAVHYLAFNVTRGPFRNRKMREAIAHVINKEGMIRKLFQNFASNAVSMVPPGMFGFNSGIRDRNLDLKKALKLKKEAGYPSDIEVSLYYSENSRNLESIAGVLVRAAKQIGVRIRKKVIPFSELINIGHDKHDMMLIGWIGDIPDADVYLYPNFSGNSGSLNRCGYTDPELSGLLEEARRISDQEKREKIYIRAQEILHRDVPLIPLYHRKNIIIHNRKVVNLISNPLSFLNFSAADYVEAEPGAGSD